jgi:hypothetical protein
MVAYWHPGRKQVRLLELSPFARGVGEGTIAFEGDVATAAYDLHQTGGRRDLRLRFAFDGPDTFRETLSEVTGPGRVAALNELDHVRSRPPATPRPRTVEGAKPSEHLKALVPLLGRTWEAGGAVPTCSTVEWVPLADAVYVRVVSPGKDAQPAHVLDAYVYHHTGTKRIRCLALSDRGGVYEGDVTSLDGGLQLDVKGNEGDKVLEHVVRFDLEKDGTMRHRLWSATGAERTLVLDVRHKQLAPKGD